MSTPADQRQGPHLEELVAKLHEVYADDGPHTHDRGLTNVAEWLLGEQGPPAPDSEAQEISAELDLSPWVVARVRLSLSRRGWQWLPGPGGWMDCRKAPPGCNAWVPDGEYS